MLNAIMYIYQENHIYALHIAATRPCKLGYCRYKCTIISIKILSKLNIVTKINVKTNNNKHRQICLYFGVYMAQHIWVVLGISGWCREHFSINIFKL